MVRSWPTDTLDIQLHDTYIILPAAPVYIGLCFWCFMLLIKYVVQGLIALARLHIVSAFVVALILLFGLLVALFGTVISYSYLDDSPETFYEPLRQMNQFAFAFTFYSTVSVGLLVIIIIVVQEIINKIRPLSLSNH